MADRDGKGRLLPGSENARKHGLSSFERHGDKSLIDPKEINALAELRLLVKTVPGRLDIREELTARVALLTSIGFSSLFERYGNPELPARLRVKMWEDPVMKRLATYAALLDRLLRGFPPEMSEDYKEELERIRKAVEVEAK